jgi:formate-dependent nitrite reductase membrane component NrfD
MAQGYERTWENRRERSRAASAEAPSGYYGLPVIKKPHWKWLIVVYFFLGGISGASYVIASIAELFGGTEGRPIVRAGRYLSLATLIPSPILLILDLGRPERFHHMLRVLKLRSPMSVGTWGLTLFGGCCGLSALIQAAQDGLFGQATPLARVLLALPRRAIAALGSVLGLFVGGYTGVLLGATAVPLWARNYLLLGPLFLASAMSTASAAVTLILALMRTTSHQLLRRLERLDMVALLAELGLVLAARANAGPVIGKPVREGHLGRILRWGVLGAGVGAPLTLLATSTFLGDRSARRIAVLSAILTLVGGFLLRYLLIMGGRASADDPQATFEFTRRRS